MPAHHTRRDLVADRESQHRRMVTELGDPRREVPADSALQGAVVQKRHVLRPGQADHDAQPLACGGIEQVPPRRRVRPDRVDAEARHLAEVRGNLLHGGKLVALRVGRKGPVGHAFDEESLTRDRLRTGRVGVLSRRSRTDSGARRRRNAQEFSVRDDSGG